MADDKLFRLGADSKLCSKCGECKPRTEFNKHLGKERAYCKSCHVASSTAWVNSNRERRRQYAREWAAKNKDRLKKYRKPHEWAAMSPERKAKKQAYAKRRHLERKYGITPEQWQEMFDRQGGVCALCKIPGRVGKHGKLAVDHCHQTGRVRGLLCAACNVSLGNLGDTVDGLTNALNYVRGSP